MNFGMNMGTHRYHAPDNEGGSDFDDLPALGGDGTGETQQDDVQERGSKLDTLLDEHLKESDRGTPAERKEKQDGTVQRDDAAGRTTQTGKGQGTNQDDRTQQRGQSDGRGQQTQQTTHTPRNVGSFFKTGADGAVYDLQGRKVADPGLGRRTLERVMRYYNGMETEHAGYKQRLDAYESANAAAKAAGLSIEESALGLRLVTSWKQDKLATLNFLLTQARNAGIDVSSIQQGGGSFDPTALREALKEQLAEALTPLQPLLQQVAEYREQTELREQVSNDIAAFFEENPEAAPHRAVLGPLMQKMDTGDPKIAWAELRVAAAQNGWDLNKPLAPQAQATKARQGNGAPTSDGNSRTVPDMTGRGGGGSGNGRVEAGSLGAASKDDSWDDIVASSIGFRP